MEDTRSIPPLEAVPADPYPDFTAELPPDPSTAIFDLPIPELPVVATPQAAPAPSLGNQVLRVAWMSIALGLFLELVLLVVSAYGGLAGDSPRPFLADLAQKISWGFIVCVGIALGSTAAKARSATMGGLGLISAPAGFVAARAAQKAVSQMLSLAGPAAADASPFLIGGLKGIEYGVLGAMIGWIAGKAWGGAGARAGAGALIGLIFGGVILLVTARFAPAAAPAVQWVSRGINEFLFPVGCSLVLYASGAMARRLG